MKYFMKKNAKRTTYIYIPTQWERDKASLGTPVREGDQTPTEQKCRPKLDDSTGVESEGAERVFLVYTHF